MTLDTRKTKKRWAYSSAALSTFLDSVEWISCRQARLCWGSNTLFRRRRYEIERLRSRHENWCA
jgi:hypothetical protein